MSVEHGPAGVRFWRLPWRFDAAALQADLARIGDEHWRTHFNTGYHDGGWSGLALISPDGDASGLYAGPEARGAGRETRLMAQCPALRAVVDRLPLTIQCARLLRLAPGSHIREHRDHGIGLDAGCARLHVPVVTAPGVEFYVDGVRVPMAAGECWYLDLGLPHRVQNRGTQQRVHLVIDCAVDDGLVAMLPSREVAERQLREIAEGAGQTSQQQFEQFRAKVLGRDDLQSDFIDIDDAAEFVDRVVRMGTDDGFSFTAEDVRSTMQAGRRAWFERNLPPGAARADPAVAPPASPSAQGLNLEEWLPVLAHSGGHGLTVELCRIGAQRFTEPFFEDSVAARMRRPFHSLFRHRLDVDALAARLQSQPGLAPAGFVFHMSRCGSTLLSQMLAASPSHRVISEPGPLDAALRCGPLPADDPRRTAWLRTLVGLLGQPANARERHYFIKFDSWHTSLLPLIRRAYPDVPWVFLIRDPVEVIVSHLRRPGAQMVPGMLGFTPPGVDPCSALAMPREEYCARMLGAICSQALAAFEHQPEHGWVVDYADLSGEIGASVLRHLGARFDDADAGALGAVLGRDAKNPLFAFESDVQTKQRQASDAVRAAADRWVMPAYRQLRAMRAGVAPATDRDTAWRSAAHTSNLTPCASGSSRE